MPLLFDTPGRDLPGGALVVGDTVPVIRDGTTYEFPADEFGGGGSYIPDARLRADTRYRRVWKPWGNALGGINGGFTVSLTVELEAEFQAARVWYANNSTTAIPITAVAVAATSAVSNGADYVGAGAWVPVSTISGGLSDPQVQFNVSGAPRSLTVPPGVDVMPGLACTDWAPVRSIPRSDGGARPLLMVRTYVAANSLGLVVPTGWEGAPSGGRIFRNHLLNGDFATTPGGAGGTPAAWGISMPFMIEYMTRDGFTVLDVGDSRAQGQTSTTNYWSAGNRAANLVSTPAFPITNVNAGLGGKNSAEYTAWGLRLLEALRPEIVLVPTFTPNDGLPSSLAVARGFALAQRARELGCTPVFQTPLPQPLSPTGSLYPAWVETQRRVLALPAYRETIFNGNAVVGDPLNPTNWLPGTTDDLLHMNDAGNALLAPAEAAVVLSLKP